MSIGLLAYTHSPHINLPWLVPIPNGPLAVRYMEILLESLSQPPLSGLVMHSKLVMVRLQTDIS